MLDSVPRARQQELYRWWLLTGLTVGITCIALISVSLYLVYIAHTHTQEKQTWLEKTKPLETHIAKLDALKKEEKELGTRVAKLHRYSTGPDILVTATHCIIHHAQSAKAQIESLLVNNQIVEVRCIVEHMHAALQLADILAKDPACGHMALVSLQHVKKNDMIQVLVTMKGPLKKPTPATTDQQPYAPETPAQKSF